MTRNVYVKIAGLLRWHEGLINCLLVISLVGGFLALWFLVPLEHFNFVGNVWFTLCGVLGILRMAVGSFNPDRDLNDKTPQETWLVIVLNLMFLVAISPWFR
jgi:hypothetical protein